MSGEELRAWIESRDASPWSSGFSEDFRRGYDAAVEEVRAALAAPSTPEPSGPTTIVAAREVIEAADALRQAGMLGPIAPNIERLRRALPLRRVMDERVREHGTDQVPSTVEAEATIVGVPTLEWMDMRAKVRALTTAAPLIPDKALTDAMAAHVAQYHAPAPPSGSWFGLPDPWAGVAFGSLPDAAPGQWWPSGGDKGGATLLSGVTFRNRPAGVNVIVLDGVINAVIDLIDFDTVPEGIYLYNCRNVTIKRLRARNLFGPFTRTGFHSGNLIQASNCSGLRISDLKLVQPATVPPGYTAYGTEDIISLGGPHGAWGDVIVERFAFDAGPWQSPSGTGLFVGDGGDLPVYPGSGYDVIVRNGILVNPGQCAIGTGEEGPYTFANIDIWSDRAGTNAAMQVRTPRVTATNVRIDWPGGNIGNAGTAADFPRPVIAL